MNKSQLYKKYIMKYNVIWLWLVLKVYTQQQIQLITNQTITMYNQSLAEPYNDSFVEITTTFNCSLSLLYTYYQSKTDLNNNTAYYLKLSNIEQKTKINITTHYATFIPTLNSSQCSAGDECVISIQNNCPNPVDFFHYFDRVVISVEGLAHFTYNVICNSSFRTNTFQWGLLIEIIFITVLITVVAIYSKAWSISGNGFTINIPMIIGFQVALVVGGVIAAFSLQAVNIIVEVLAWIFGTLGVGLCINQLLYLLKLDFLRVGTKLKSVDFRVMQGISLVLGLGTCFGWWFSNKNWIVNDIVAVCITVACIKILKFTSLRIALICFCCTITVQMVFVIIIQFVIKVSYNNIILNEFNNPFELQAPTINPVFNQKCAWLPVTAVLYPGALMSYMRRFDTSRSTNVYLITCVVLFFCGSILWMFISIFSPHSWPFGLVAEPAMIGLVSFFAWKRKQIRTLWEGKFYDEEFANKEALNNISEMIRRETQMSYRNSMFKGLEINDEESCADHTITQSVVKDKL